jgi:hypothetical protein
MRRGSAEERKKTSPKVSLEFTSTPDGHHPHLHKGRALRTLHVCRVTWKAGTMEPETTIANRNGFPDFMQNKHDK